MLIPLRNLAFAALSLLPLSGCADSLLLHPTTQPLHVDHAQARTISSDKGALQIWTSRADARAEPGAILVTYVGNASRAEDVVASTAHRWRSVNAEVWALNYPGFGGSPGMARVGSIAPAALAAFDAATLAAGGKPVFVAGRSIGTTAALYVAAHRPVAGILLHSPAPLTTVIMGRFGWWNLWIGATLIAAQVPRELDSVRNAARCSAPAVFIVSERDRLVVPAHQRKVISAYQGERSVVSLNGAGHNTAPTVCEENAIEAAVDWLARSAKPNVTHPRPRTP